MTIIIKGIQSLEVRLGDGGAAGENSTIYTLIRPVVQQACDFLFAIKEVNSSGNHQCLWLLTPIISNTGACECRKNRLLHLTPDFNHGNFVTPNFLKTCELIT